MIIYVDCNAAGEQLGTMGKPFRTISQAAQMAGAGDVILVEPGEYREHVSPVNSGRKDQPVVYRSRIAGGAVITGAECVKNWKALSDGVWTAEVDNAVFGDYNPYTTLISGDWYMASFIAHTGDVFLGHKSLYEVSSREKVFQREKNTSSWDEQGSQLVWFSEQQGTKTCFYAFFGDKNPNEETVEISVRKNCFMPKEEGVSYITLQGFVIREAATQWAPPTAYQDGMVGPHWSKGWVIEDCEIYESKCSGISLGKKLQPENDNKWLKWKYKDGTQTERECICQASYDDWTKEKVGSHVVRNCYIHDCGQTGIVGHLGGVFSIIENNHICRINNKKNLAGAEIGGIKMHAAIDVQIRGNHIHHCTRGLWLDWQAQGTRVTDNFFHHNFPNIDLNQMGIEELKPYLADMGEDIFVEVSHGPTMIDNNYLLSERSIKLAAQGVAVINNLIAGSLTCVGTGTDNGTINVPSPRYTPYHVPHGTAIAGFMTILHGDCHFYNNIFVQKKISKSVEEFPDLIQAASKTNPVMTAWDTMNFSVGTKPYDEYPTYEEWDAMFEGYCGMGSPQSDRYYTHLPVRTGGNHFFNGASPCRKEKNGQVHENVEVQIRVVPQQEEGAGHECLCRDGWKVLTDVYEYVDIQKFEEITSETLGIAFEPEMRYENPDGSSITF